DKRDKRDEKRGQETSGKLADMIMYVDHMGNLTPTPPDPTKKKEIKLESIEIGVPKASDMEDEDPIRKGVVTFFNTEKGYGFIKDSDSQDSIFVHINNTLEEIKENNMVTFEVEMGQKGPTAVRVKVNR
ncbi:MAG: cold shock domain-containing protein, partial [Spirosomaceae bacterium]|nr:cold shock domain-containing protein [Spirosomataceae bacterium]